MPAQLIQLETAPDLVDRVYRALLDAISEGSLAPGQRITQEEIAEQLAVSRQPVLQALRLLKKDGLIHDAAVGVGASAKGRGIVVAPLDAGWIAQVYEVRGALDALAARLAASRKHALDAAPARRGPQGRARQEHQGHDRRRPGLSPCHLRSIGQPAHHPNRRAALVPFAPRHGRGAAVCPVSANAVWDEHSAIAAAIAAGDGDLAASLIAQHGQRASHRLAEGLAQVLQTQTTPTTAGDKA